MAKSKSAISFDNVSYWYETSGTKTAVLKDLSLDIGEGEFVALVGRSGCGKTTLLNLVSGLAQPRTGSVTIRGEAPDRHADRIGYMFARPSLLPWRRVLSNAELALEVRGTAKRDRKARAEKELARVGLSEYAKYFPLQLSQGMRQRVAMARTWSLDPEILLMDEPFAALDAQTRLTIEKDFLEQWQAKPSTVLFVTHDLSEAIALADRVIVMRTGQISLDMRIPLTRPRDPEEVLSNDQFPKIYQELRRALNSE